MSGPRPRPDDPFDGDDDPPARYERLARRFKWNPYEELAARYVYLCQPSAVRMCECLQWICRTIARRPTSVKSDSAYEQVRETMIRNRSVTRQIDDGYEKVLLTPIMTANTAVFKGWRRDDPFTWTEVHRFFAQYDVKPEHDRQRVVFKRFVALLGRAEDEEPRVQRAWDLWHKSGPDALLQEQPDFDVRTEELADILRDVARFGGAVPKRHWARFKVLARGGA